jgi:hypothetical protein
MWERPSVNRRGFMQQSLTVVGSAGIASTISDQQHQSAQAAEQPGGAADARPMPVGQIGDVRISRMLLGGNLIAGWMHARDLKYVGALFRAYATEEKILETLQVAEAHGINTVFESGAEFVDRYNRETGGKMQFIPHIEVNLGDSDARLSDHIKRQVDTGAVALYVWGVSGDKLAMEGRVDRIAVAVEIAKQHDLPVGVGSHSLQVPIQCEKLQVPCDFYVKTLHRDDYPSAIPKPLRKDFVWHTGGPGYYDNMWCLDPEETIEFMRTVTKPWIAFKVLAAGAYLPREGFQYAFDHGADFIAVGMLDFQIRGNCEVAHRALQRSQTRQRPWRA